MISCSVRVIKPPFPFPSALWSHKYFCSEKKNLKYNNELIINKKPVKNNFIYKEYKRGQSRDYPPTKKQQPEKRSL